MFLIINKIQLYSLLVIFMFSVLSTQVMANDDFMIRDLLINELDETNQWVEIFNPSNTAIDIPNYWLFNRSALSGNLYNRIGTNAVTLMSGSLVVAPGAYTVLGWSQIGVGVASELGLYKTSNFGNSADMEDYIMYNGIASPNRAGVAVAAGVWANATDFVPALSNSSNTFSLVIGTYSSGEDSDVIFRARQLEEQFEVILGATLLAEIAPCN